MQSVQDDSIKVNKNLKRKKLLARGVGFATFAFAAVVLVVTLLGVSRTVDELGTEIAKNKADVILASADIDSDTLVKVPILYYDQKMDACVDLYDIHANNAVNARQFEWQSCGYYGSEIETGLVKPELDAMYLPVSVGGLLLPNRGMSGDNFKRWFNAVDGVNSSYASTIGLTYDSENAKFSYESEEFYPLNEIAVPEESVNADENNHLFTLNLGVPFRALLSGDEEFAITADDDTWVFVGDALVIDMGGIHDATTGRFKINSEGEVYAGVEGENLAFTGVKLSLDGGAIIRIFHADRNAASSVFKISFSNMVLNITNSSLAREDGGVEVAYDPANPSYIPPLGESLTVEPNKTRALAGTISIQMLVIGVLAVIIIMVISVAWRYSRYGRNQE